METGEGAVGMTRRSRQMTESLQHLLAIQATSTTPTPIPTPASTPASSPAPSPGRVGKQDKRGKGREGKEAEPVKKKGKGREGGMMMIPGWC